MSERTPRFVQSIAGFLRAIASLVSPARLVGAYVSLSKRERIAGIIALLIGIVGVGVWVTHFYVSHTTLVPAQGGTFAEGMVDQPYHINPVLPDANETDQVMESLIFSGLTKSNGTGGYDLDLAQNIEKQHDGVTYLVTLKNNLVWQDNEPLTTQDVLFTLDLLKNKDLQNPQAYFWNTVQIQAVSGTILKFTLQNPDSYFPAYLSFKILPYHLWKSVPVNQITISELNLKPIGSGPYQFKKMTLAKDQSISQYTLTRFSKYASEGPYFDTVVVKFYPSVDDALVALKKKDIESVAHVPTDTFSAQKNNQSFITLDPAQATMTLLAFNMNQDPLKDKAMRQAVAASIDSHAIAQDVYEGYANWSLASQDATASSPVDLARAQNLLASLGWQDSNKDGIVDKKLSPRAKTPTDLTLNLLTLDTPDMQRIAAMIQKQLGQAGIGVTIQALDVNEYTNQLHNRTFQMALIAFSPVGAPTPDWYPLLHSSQQQYPGLNISGYANQAADTDMEQIRSTDDPTTVQAVYAQLIAQIASDAPFAFIVQPTMPWLMTNGIHLSPITSLPTSGDRLSTINQWYWYTKRIWTR